MEKLFRKCLAWILISIFVAANPVYYAGAKTSRYSVEPQQQKVSVEEAEKRIRQFIAEIEGQIPGDIDLPGLSFTSTGSSFAGDKVEAWEKKNGVPFQNGPLTEAFKKARREWL